MTKFRTIFSQREWGFTLVELMVGMAILGVLATLGAAPMRNYWLRQGLAGASDDVTTQLRGMQERAVSESHPLIYGALFTLESSEWAIVRFDSKTATTTTDDVCEILNPREFEGGVVVSAVEFSDPPAEVTTACSSIVDDEATDELVFFYARGSATGGQVTVRQPTLNDTETVTVGPITGRVSRN